MTCLQWAQEAFNTPPEAVNFWMGTNESVTSLHKVWERRRGEEEGRGVGERRRGEEEGRKGG